MWESLKDHIREFREEHPTAAKVVWILLILLVMDLLAMIHPLFPVPLAIYLLVLLVRRRVRKTKQYMEELRGDRAFEESVRYSLEDDEFGDEDW